jgi:branched-chain amino acid transport system permease protein
MLGTVLREAVRLFYPQGSNPKPFPRLLPTESMSFGSFTLRADSMILLLAGLAANVAVPLLINRTKLGLAIRAVAQDAETARIMGINFEFIVLLTFAIGSGMAALGGLMNGLYYNEINFGIGLLLGVIGFSAAVVGGRQHLQRILGLPLFRAAKPGWWRCGAARHPPPTGRGLRRGDHIHGLRPHRLIAEKRARSAC